MAWKCRSMRSMQWNSMRCPPLLHGSAWGARGPSASELSCFLLSLQNSLKASNRKKKRTSFKRKASKRGTEVSVSGLRPRELHPPHRSHLCLPTTCDLARNSFSDKFSTLLPSFTTLKPHTGIPFSFWKMCICITSGYFRIRAFALVHGRIIPKMMKIENSHF